MKYRKNSNTIIPALLTAYWFIVGFVLMIMHVVSPQSEGLSEVVLAVSYVALGFTSSLWFSYILRRSQYTWMKLFVSAGYVLSSVVAYFITIYALFALEVSGLPVAAPIRQYVEVPGAIVIAGNLTLLIGTACFYAAAWVAVLIVRVFEGAVRLVLKKK